jgi:hypothetical protein
MTLRTGVLLQSSVQLIFRLLAFLDELRSIVAETLFQERNPSLVSTSNGNRLRERRADFVCSRADGSFRYVIDVSAWRKAEQIL